MLKSKIVKGTLSGLLLSSLFLAGCSSSSGGDGGDKTTVEIFQFKVEFKQQFEAVAEQYEKENPNVDLKITTVGGGNDYKSAITSKFSSGEEPAIFNIGGPTDVKQFKDRLTDLSDTEAAKAAQEGTLDGVTVDGEVLGVPYNQEGYGFIYNKRILKEAGIDPMSLTTYDKLEKAYLESIETLRFTVEAKDTYTRGHSDRVSEYSVLLGQKLNLSVEEINTLKIGGLFHDIGKIGVPDSILLKNSKLTDDEYSEIKNHPTIGAHILSNATIFKDVIPVVKHHHERFDGNGYPAKLKGLEIPYLARIAAVADAFDAMTSRRTYRDSMDLDFVKTEIEKCKGTQFDPNCADAFLDILNNDFEKIKKIREKYKPE